MRVLQVLLNLKLVLYILCGSKVVIVFNVFRFDALNTNVKQLQRFGASNTYENQIPWSGQ